VPRARHPPLFSGASILAHTQPRPSGENRRARGATLVTAARPIRYDYHTREIAPTGGPVDADTLGTINVEGWELIARVAGHEGYNLLIWFAPWDALGDEGQHYLAHVQE
jgi:hypothetical protein